MKRFLSVGKHAERKQAAGMLDTPKPLRRASPWEGPASSVSNYMCEYSAALRPRRIPFIMISTVTHTHTHTHTHTKTTLILFQSVSQPS